MGLCLYFFFWKKKKYIHDNSCIVYGNVSSRHYVSLSKSLSSTRRSIPTTSASSCWTLSDPLDSSLAPPWPILLPTPPSLSYQTSHPTRINLDWFVIPSISSTHKSEMCVDLHVIDFLFQWNWNDKKTGLQYRDHIVK